MHFRLAQISIVLALALSACSTPRATQNPQQGTGIINTHPALPNLAFHLFADQHEDDPGGWRQHVGQIQITKSNTVFQVIDVFAEAPIEMFVRHFELIDINSDGFPDIASIAEFGGSKWGRTQYWLYDPKSARFISNWLTKKLSQFKCNEICVDNHSKEIHVHNLTYDGVIDACYAIRGHRLALVSTIEVKAVEKGFIVTTKHLLKGKLQPIKVEFLKECPASDRPPQH